MPRWPLTGRGRKLVDAAAQPIAHQLAPRAVERGVQARADGVAEAAADVGEAEARRAAREGRHAAAARGEVVRHVHGLHARVEGQPAVVVDEAVRAVDGGEGNLRRYGYGPIQLWPIWLWPK